jgi:hypothetical protein
MERDDEMKLFQAAVDGEILRVDCAAIVALPSSDGQPTILLPMASDDGKRYVVPLSRDLALMLGEQMVRAVDAIDAGLVKADWDAPKT